MMKFRKLCQVPALVLVLAPLLGSCDRNPVEPSSTTHQIEPGRTGEFSLGSLPVDGGVVDVKARNLTWDSTEEIASLDVFLVNRSRASIAAPLNLVVAHIHPSTVELINEDGVTGDDLPFKTFDAAAFGDDGLLTPGESSGVVEFMFDVGGERSFSLGFRIDSALGSISGIVFRDDNRNGTRDANEPGLADVAVLMTPAANAASTAITARTNHEGLYRFTGLEAGVYELTVAAPAGATPTTTDPLFVTLLGRDDGTVGDYDEAHFGLYIPDSGNGGVIRVRKDGTGDFTTIAGAVAFAADGDAIEVGPGVYVEAVEIIQKHLNIYSLDGPSSTILDGHGTLQMLNYKNSGGRLDGFLLRNGWYENGGGAITVLISGELHITNCMFEDNHAGFQGGALSTGGSGINLTVTDCTFRRNSAPTHGGALLIIQDAHVTIDNCAFVDNTTSGTAGAITCGDSDIRVSHCLFAGNESSDVAGGIYLSNGSRGTVEQNTFYGSSSAAGTVVVNGSPISNVQRNIFVGDARGVALDYFVTELDGIQAGLHSCNIFWRNAAGAIRGVRLAADELIANPLFCGPSAGDFRLDSASPAAPAASPCGLLIGAFPVGCAVSPGG